jgi:hypothetical protein
MQNKWLQHSPMQNKWLQHSPMQNKWLQHSPMQNEDKCNNKVGTGIQTTGVKVF